MTKSLGIVLLLLTCSVSGQNTFNFKKDHQALAVRAKDSKDPLFFDTQLKRFKENDLVQTDLEVLSMLVAFSQDPEFAPIKDSFRESVVQELITGEKYSEAVHIADKLLKGNPLNIKGIYAKSHALLKMGQKDSANVYAKQWQKILKAMFLSGKGTSMSDPTFSLGPDDGSPFIGMFIGAEITAKRAEKNPEGQTIQVYEALLDKKKLTLYFMIDHAVKRMEEESKRK